MLPRGIGRLREVLERTEKAVLAGNVGAAMALFALLERVARDHAEIVAELMGAKEELVRAEIDAELGP